MRIIYFIILTVLVASCTPLPQQQAVVLEKHPDHPPEICDAVTSAIDRGDWSTLRTLTKPSGTAVPSIDAWENAMKMGHAVQVGKFLNAQTVAEAPGRQYELYSFALTNRDGTVNPHWLQIKVREVNGRHEIMDFWNFGW